MKRMFFLIVIMTLMFLLCGCVDSETENKADNQPIDAQEKRSANIKGDENINPIATEIIDENANSIDEPAIKSEEKKTSKQEYPFNYISSDGTEYITMRLDAFHTETMFDMFDFMIEPEESNLYMCIPQVFRFVKNNGNMTLKSMAYADWNEDSPAPTELSDVDGVSEYYSQAIAFLCDKIAIKKVFNDNGINDISNVVIVELEQGYVVVAVRKNDAYYMTVPTVAEKYGDFIFQKIYTAEEFKKIYGPRSAKVFVNDKEEVSLSQSILGEHAYGMSERYYLEIDILELAQALGVRGICDEETKTITVGDYVMRFESSHWGEIDTRYVEFIESAPIFDVYVSTLGKTYQSPGIAVYRNGRYLGSYTTIRQLCQHLGYQMEVSLKDYSVYIYDTEGRFCCVDEEKDM